MVANFATITAEIEFRSKWRSCIEFLDLKRVFDTFEVGESEGQVEAEGEECEKVVVEVHCCGWCEVG